MATDTPEHVPKQRCRARRRPRTAARGPPVRGAHAQLTAHTVGSLEIDWIRANDPSAGSPTETLLRLLLPLSAEVH